MVSNWDTGNIYDLGAPSIARGIDITGLIDMEDATEIYIGSIAMFVHGFYVLDKSSDEYIQIEADEYTELLEALGTLPQSELSTSWIWSKLKVSTNSAHLSTGNLSNTCTSQTTPVS